MFVIFQITDRDFEHADFDSDLMSERLNSDETMNISQCDVTGVLQSNQWKLVNDNSVQTFLTKMKLAANGWT
jgi:hypothetical protein